MRTWRNAQGNCKRTYSLMEGLKLGYRRLSIPTRSQPTQVRTFDFSQPQYCTTDVWISKGPHEIAGHSLLSPVG